MKRKPWLCRSICPRRSSPYSSSFSHYVGICDSSAFINTHVQLTSSINISFFLTHMKAQMTPIDASQQHCPEHTAISHACPPIIVRCGFEYFISFFSRLVRKSRKWRYIVKMEAHEYTDGLNECSTTESLWAHSNIVCVSPKNLEICASNSTHHSFHDLSESHEHDDTSWWWKHRTTPMAWTNAARQNCLV